MHHHNPRLFEIFVAQCNLDLDMTQIFQHAKTPDQIVLFLNSILIITDKCLPFDVRLFSNYLNVQDWMVVFAKIGEV